MVIKQRSSFDSSFNVYDNAKSTVPYGNNLIKRFSSCGSTGSKRDQSHIPVFLDRPTQDEGYKANFMNKVRSLGSNLPLVKISLFVFLCYYTLSLYNDLTERNIVLRDIRQEFENAELTLEQNDAKVKSALGSIKSLQSQFGQLLSEEQRETIADGKELNSEMMYQKIVDKQSTMASRVNELQNRIAELHRKQAEDMFGYGPYRVQFNIKIDGSIHSFIVELAGIDLMPHSVHFFMQMVEAKVWDQTAFNHQASHILFAELKDSEGNDKMHLLKEKRISTTLSFPEYTDKYPHHKYTLGFSGRPGGPAFYINTDNNGEFHGPGGQKDHALLEEADPCFGTVIEGQHVVDWMQLKTETGHTDDTVIDSIRIIG